MKKMIEKIKCNSLFTSLQEIGGGKEFHGEGNALIHTLLVYEAAVKEFGEGHEMTLVALLHDIGKINFADKAEEELSYQKENGDWAYPNHARSGAQHLGLFIKEQDDPELFARVKWYLENHIKPLYWKGKTTPMPKGCKLSNLFRLALCDLEGSYAQDTKASEALKYKIQTLIFNCED